MKLKNPFIWEGVEVALNKELEIFLRFANQLIWSGFCIFLIASRAC
jgi:hypothetical protein